MEANEIIIRPLLTEKSYAGIQNKIYSFVVDKRANKVQIAQAVETMFNVEVQKLTHVSLKDMKNHKTQNKEEQLVRQVTIKKQSLHSLKNLNQLHSSKVYLN